jgi:hypothetical protein
MLIAADINASNRLSEYIIDREINILDGRGLLVRSPICYPAD